MNTFMDDYQAGDASQDDIYAYIDAWVDSEADVGVSEWLGMTRSEYAWWSQNLELPMRPEQTP